MELMDYYEDITKSKDDAKDFLYTQAQQQII